MSLQEKLNDLKASFEAKAPQEVLAIMHRAINDLGNSGIMDRITKAGDAAPAFELANADNKIVRLNDLLSDGPLVLGFYRGKW